MTSPWHLSVSQDDLTRTRLVEVSEPEPAAGEAVLRVDRVGLTANNVTYATFGQTMRYWDFFPTEPGSGVVPLWGFADVVASRVDGLSRGRAPLRLPADRQPPGRAAAAGRGPRLPRRHPAPRDAAVGVQHLPPDHRRPGLRGGPRGPAGALPPAVLHVLHARRPVPGPGQLGRRRRGAVVGLEQDGVRDGRPAAGAGAAGRRPDLVGATSPSRRASAATTASWRTTT